ncbi:MAG: N-acyl homoserine lactonase family protein [Actinomycetota bacterium]|nr:N-acyl homoserine lactonase family protein [Actinomycetota bacterium]
MTVAPAPTGTARQLRTLRCGGENTLNSLFDPWDPNCGEIVYLPYRFWAVEHARGWVLIDSGPHPSLARDPALRLGAQATLSDIREDGDDVVGRLGTIGVDASAVTDVIATHLHYDHCGGLELLPQAAVHIQEAELAFANDPPVYQRSAYIPADWATVHEWAVHNGEHDLFDDGSIILIPTPGHTPGHQSVLIRLPEATFICVADAAYHPQKMTDRKLPGYLWNPDAIIDSWERLEQLQAQTSATFLFSHHPGSEPRNSEVT